MAYDEVYQLRGRRNNIMGDSIFISVPEAARMLGVSRSKGWQLARSGDMPTARIGGRVLVPVDGLKVWASSLVNQAG